MEHNEGIPEIELEAIGAIELNGINVIPEDERRGKPRDLFFPWFAGNITVFSMSYGAYALGFGISFWQATFATIIGTVGSYFICGLVSIAGKRGSAPTLTLSRSTFGVNGNKLPCLLAWILSVGWETILMATAVLASVAVFDRLGWGSGTGVKIGAFVVVASITISIAVWGFAIMMRAFLAITIATGVLTIGYFSVTADKVNWSVLSDHPSGSFAALVGAIVLVMTGEGLGWLNIAADYSRYLPRRSSSSRIVGWTMAGGGLAGLVTIGYGLLLAGSDPKLSAAIGDNPVGALVAALPTWYIFPFAAVVLLGLVGSSVLQLYSSGLVLLALGLRIPRPGAVAIDGFVMVVGSIYMVFFAKNFVTPFIAFLTTIGVAITAWAGIFLADLALRQHDYDEADLYRPAGRYGSVQGRAVALLLVTTLIGWGLISNAGIGWLKWQGFLLSPLGFGGRDGAWAFSNVGVLVALGVGFVGWYILGRSTVRGQELAPRSNVMTDHAKMADDGDLSSADNSL